MILTITRGVLDLNNISGRNLFCVNHFRCDSKFETLLNVEYEQSNVYLEVKVNKPRLTSFLALQKHLHTIFYNSQGSILCFRMDRVIVHFDIGTKKQICGRWTFYAGRSKFRLRVIDPKKRFVAEFCGFEVSVNRQVLFCGQKWPLKALF